jgi:hypothetical protein
MTSASEASLASNTPTATILSLISNDPRDLNYNFMPESDDPGYLSHYYNFLRDWNKWHLNNDKALGGVQGLLEPTMEKLYITFNEPNALWNRIKDDFESVMMIDGQSQQEKVQECKLESYSSVLE